VDYGLNDQMIDQLEYFIPLLTMGNFIINQKLNNSLDQEPVQLFALVISILNVWLPSQ
jgi:hypothetical protein